MEHSDALISKFISLLQVNGHKVLRGELKLKLTDEFLTEINALLKSHVNSVQSKERKNKIQFLRNFLGNTLKLKINQASINGSSLRGSSQSSSQISSSSSDFTQPSSSLGSSIIYSVSQTVLDLTDFTKLKYLELYKVSPLNIIGKVFFFSFFFVSLNTQNSKRHPLCYYNNEIIIEFKPCTYWNNSNNITNNSDNFI